MAVQNIAGGGTGNTGALAANTLFFVESGLVWLSTDGGTTKIPFRAGMYQPFATGLTVTWFNDQPTAAILKYMSF